MKCRETFATKYCAARKIEPENFEAAWLEELLPPLSRPLARAATFLDRNSFSDEQAILRSFRNLQDPASFEGQLIGVHNYNEFTCPRWKSWLGLQISSDRIRDAAEVLESPREN